MTNTVSNCCTVAQSTTLHPRMLLQLLLLDTGVLTSLDELVGSNSRPRELIGWLNSQGTSCNAQTAPDCLAWHLSRLLLCVGSSSKCSIISSYIAPLSLLTASSANNAIGSKYSSWLSLMSAAALPVLSPASLQQLDSSWGPDAALLSEEYGRYAFSIASSFMGIVSAPD